MRIYFCQGVCGRIQEADNSISWVSNFSSGNICENVNSRLFSHDPAVAALNQEIFGNLEPISPISRKIGCKFLCFGANSGFLIDTAVLQDFSRNGVYRDIDTVDGLITDDVALIH